jgi:hypothetical protein
VLLELALELDWLAFNAKNQQWILATWQRCE